VKPVDPAKLTAAIDATRPSYGEGLPGGRVLKRLCAQKYARASPAHAILDESVHPAHVRLDDRPSGSSPTVDRRGPS
jgi:hypothetical protein